MKSARKTIGLIAGGFKPFTAGHYNLVQKASSECDEVKLFVSIGDRKRQGELPLTWAQMQPIWNEYLEPAIKNLGNVDVVYAKTPVRSIYELLIDANADTSNYNSYFIYSDPEDAVNNYGEEKQIKYWPRLMENDQFTIKMINRGETGGISGTVMRKALAKGDMEAFIAGLPEQVKLYGPAIFDSLRQKAY
jgi:cytidyltransferase-like protein